MDIVFNVPQSDIARPFLVVRDNDGRVAVKSLEDLGFRVLVKESPKAYIVRSGDQGYAQEHKEISVEVVMDRILSDEEVEATLKYIKQILESSPCRHAEGEIEVRLILAESIIITI